LAGRAQERVELYLYSPYGPYGLYRASVPVQGCTLPLSLPSYCAAIAEPSHRPATKNVYKTRGCNYSFCAPDDGRCVARNMLSN